MERWCETAAAVANNWRSSPISPAQAAAHCVNWQRICIDDASSASDAAAQLSAGEYDHVIRRLPHVGGDNER